VLTDLGGEDQAAAVSEAERERLQPRPEVGSDCPASRAAEAHSTLPRSIQGTKFYCLLAVPGAF